MTPASATDLSAGVAISVGGPLDPKLAAKLIDVRVETTTGLPDVCTMRFAEGDASAGNDLPTIDEQKFKLAAPVTVKLAAPVGQGGPKPGCDGEITTIEAEFGAGPLGEPVLELIVTAHDNSHRLHRKTTTRTFRQTTVSDIAKKMAGEHGLKMGTIAALGGGAPEERHQVGETDWSYLSRLVARHGGELDISGGKLNILDPTKTKGQVAELVYGEGLERFRPRISSVGQVAEVNVTGWDVKKKKEILKTAAPKGSTSVQNSAVNGAISGSKAAVVTALVSSDAEAEAAAKGIAARLGHERLQAEAVASGDPLLLAGEDVKIAGVGTRFSGQYRIASAVHQYGRRGYKTKLTLGSGGRPLAALGGAASARPPAFADGLAIAIVTDNKDPDKLGRVKIKYPTLPDSVESGWVRIARETSGKERGTVGLPHVNDEVVVGFEHGDVRRPYILGTLFNGVDTPGADLLKTTSSVAARFPRDLDVATKEKVMLVAGKDISVKADKGMIDVAAGKEFKLAASKGGPPSPITIETTGQIKASGKQGVEIAANGPLKITSTAPVTIESNAALQLKGSIVQVQASGVLQLSGATVMLG